MRSSELLRQRIVRKDIHHETIYYDQRCEGAQFEEY